MTYPANLDTIVVRHKIVDTGGRPLKGNSVRAVATKRIWATDGSLIPFETTAQVQADGTYEFELPYVDQDGIHNKGVPFQVTEDVPGSPRHYFIAPVLAHGAGPIDATEALVEAPVGYEVKIQAGPVTDEAAAQLLDQDGQFKARLTGTFVSRPEVGTLVETPAGARAKATTAAAAAEAAAKEYAGTLAYGTNLEATEATVAAFMADPTSEPRQHVVAKGELVVNVVDYGAIGDGDPANAPVNDAAFEAAIDSGRHVYVPAGDYYVTSIRMDGPNGGMGEVSLIGAGRGLTTIRQTGGARAIVPGHADNTQSPNVIEARSGHGFTLKGMTVIANAQTGGIKPMRAMGWVQNYAYVYDPDIPIYRATTATGDLTTSTDKSPDVKVWKLAASHTSNSTTSILPDVTAGHWVEAGPDDPGLNYYWYGESFNRNHAISITADHGTPRITQVRLEDVHAQDAAYASILIGTGAVVHESYMTAGANDVLILNCSTSGSAAGIGGGHKDRLTISNCHISATSNLINVDEGSKDVTITGCIIYGDPVKGGGNGVSSYQSHYVTVSGNTITNCAQGVNFQDTASSSSRTGSISGNTFVGCGTAISVGGDNNTVVNGNTIHHPSLNGIVITDCWNVAVTGNTVMDSGVYGMQIRGGHGNTITGNAVVRSNRDGYYIHQGAYNTQFVANQAENNNRGDVGAHGFRVEGGATRLTFIGNQARAYGTPGQQYGLHLAAGITQCLVMGNDFRNNLAGDILNEGSQNTIGFNQSATTAFQTAVGILPTATNTLTLGTASQRWAGVYSTRYYGYNGTRGIRWIEGNPNGSVVGTLGDVAINVSGGAGATFWVKETGIDTNTGWVAK